jgi:Methylmalonyl-CoA mutase, N-terminal domain/subunit
MANKLFTEFPPVSTKEWEDAIISDLKGADYEKKLVWRTQEGFSVRPYYRGEDTAILSGLDAKPGEFPYRRGVSYSNDWLVRQDYCAHKSCEEANRLALDGISKGVDAVGFGIDAEHDYSDDEIRTLLKGIDPSRNEVDFKGCLPKNTTALNAFLKVCEEKGLDNKDIKASFDFSPLHRLVTAGAICDDCFGWLADILNSLKDYPQVAAICADGYDFNNAGSSIVQETAYALGEASDYMKTFTGKYGLCPTLVASKIRFRLSIGSNYFMEIAKLRAARVLWAETAKSFNAAPEACKMQCDAITSRWNQTLYDSYVNMLRGTTESMSAAIGGVHSLTVLPFDSAYEEPAEFSNRIARNVQIILKEESHFNAIADPAGGSYYVEELTESVKAAAGALFNATCSGDSTFRARFEDGTVRKAIEDVASKRDAAIAKGREALLGTNAFPNYDETEIDNARKEAKVEANAPLRFYRGAEPFEEMRLATERSGRRPKAFMLTYGNLAMCRARAQFSGNFFAMAGFEIIDNNRFASIEDGVKTAEEAKADIVVACSSDEEYAEGAPKIFALVGKNVLTVVAGDPECRPQLEEAGIRHFISVRSDILETLRGFQKELGLI